MNTKRIFSVLFTFAINVLIFAQGSDSDSGVDGHGTGYGEEPPVKAPIDTYQMVLIVAAVLLTVGVIMYNKRRSLKKA